MSCYVYDIHIISTVLTYILLASKTTSFCDMSLGAVDDADSWIRPMMISYMMHDSNAMRPIICTKTIQRPSKNDKSCADNPLSFTPFAGLFAAAGAPNAFGIMDGELLR